MKKKTTKLDGIRTKIDAVDTDILKLLNRRTKLVLDIADTKKRAGTAFYVPKREKVILERLQKMNKGPFPNRALRNVFREIMSASLSLEKPVKIAFLGPVATFTHQACIEHFGLSGDFIPKNNIADVFEDVEKGRADFGVVPIENTAEGVVTHTLDMFVPSNLKIRAEVMLEVSLALMNSTGRKQDIRKVASHPHALAQCRNWLKENLPDATLFNVASTATAAKLASEDPASAAVASSAAANLYNLRVLENHVEDTSNNYTRFLVIGKHLVKRTGEDKTAIVFAIKDAPGALFKMLQPFAKRGINLTKIESRPMKTRAWEYIFFIDLEGHVKEKKVKEAVEELEKSCLFLKVLGSYPRSPVKAGE
ncbi:MAG: prephenate dehydratase [Thermodesulfobacteriota bacterium]